MKVAINRCWGGFGLSKEANDLMASWGHPGALHEIKWREEEYAKHPKRAGLYDNSFNPHCDRHDPLLIKAIETLGEEKASGDLGKVHIVEIPDGVQYEIDDYDGMETIHEQHRSWP
jgi:hypothetical protein